LAGKLEKICTAFPLTTFLRNVLRGYILEVFDRKKFLKATVDRKSREKTTAPHLESNFDIT